MRRPVRFEPFVSTDREQVRKLQRLIARMCDADRREIFALRLHGDHDAFLHDVVALHSGVCAVEAALIHAIRPFGYVEPEPIAFAGAYRVTPALASLSFFAAPEARRYMPAIIDGLSQKAATFGARHGLALAEAKTASSYSTALKWLGRTGARVLGRLPGIGASGEDFMQLVWEFD